MDKTLRLIGLAVLYMLASPVYLFVFLRKAMKFSAGAALMRRG